MNSNCTLRSLLQARQNVALFAGPGLGKTSRIHEVSRDCGFRLLTERMVRLDRVDFSGAMVPDLDAGITRQLPMSFLNDLQTTIIPTLVFFDDVGQATSDVQAAMMGLWDSGAISPHVVMWCASNLVTHRAGVVPTIEPLRSRFPFAFVLPTPPKRDDKGNILPDPWDAPDGPTVLHDWPTELEHWNTWALDSGMPPASVAFHRATNGEFLYQWSPNSDPSLRMPDYRSWEATGRAWNLGVRSQHCLNAVLGKPTASRFGAFAALADEIVTPDQVRLDPRTAPIPESNNGKYLISTMLTACCAPRDLDPFMIYASRMPQMFYAFLMRYLGRKPSLKSRLEGSVEWNKAFNANLDLFQV